MTKEKFVAVRRNNDGDLVAFKSTQEKNTITKQPKNFVKKDSSKTLKPSKVKVVVPISAGLSMVIKITTYQTYQTSNFRGNIPKALTNQCFFSSK